MATCRLLKRLDIIFPVLPPTIDGIGDHTAHLARAMARHVDVRILTAQESWDPIEGVEVVRAFDMDTRRGVLAACNEVAKRAPDWVILQFNQYSYGRWGVNPFLPLLIRRIRALERAPQVAFLAHEDFIPIRNVKSAVFGTIQRLQFLGLGRGSDLFLTTIEPWAKKYGAWFGEDRTRVLPVGANIPNATTSRDDARQRIGVAESELIIGYFGSVRIDRRFDAVTKLLRAVTNEGSPTRILYVGKDGAEASRIAGPEFVIDVGPLGAQDAANTLIASDIWAAPYIDGLSCRRGGFLAGLQLGVPSLSNVGVLTDQALIDLEDTCFVLAPDATDESFVQSGLKLARDPAMRLSLAVSGSRLYEEMFSWPSIANRLQGYLTVNAG